MLPGRNYRRTFQRVREVDDQGVSSGSDSNDDSDSEQEQEQVPARGSDLLLYKQYRLQKKSLAFQKQKDVREQREKEEQANAPKPSEGARDWRQHIGFQNAAEIYALDLLWEALNVVAVPTAPLVKIATYAAALILGLIPNGIACVGGAVYKTIYQPDLTYEDVFKAIASKHVELADRLSTFATQLGMSFLTLGGTFPGAMSEYFAEHGYSHTEDGRKGWYGLAHWFKAYTEAGLPAIGKSLRSHITPVGEHGASTAQMGGAAAANVAAAAARRPAV